MVLDSQDQNAIVNYVKPAHPTIIICRILFISIVLGMEVGIYGDSTFVEFFITIIGSTLIILAAIINILDAARLEFDNVSVRRSFFGWNFINIPWANAEVIRGFYLCRENYIGHIGTLAVTSKTRMNFLKIIAFQDEAGMLAPKLNLIAKQFGIPLEQRLVLYQKPESVDAIRFK